MVAATVTVVAAAVMAVAEGRSTWAEWARGRDSPDGRRERVSLAARGTAGLVGKLPLRSEGLSWAPRLTSLSHLRMVSWMVLGFAVECACQMGSARHRSLPRTQSIHGAQDDQCTDSAC